MSLSFWWAASVSGSLRFLLWLYCSLGRTKAPFTSSQEGDPIRKDRASVQMPFALASHTPTLYFLIFFAISKLHFFSSYFAKTFREYFRLFSSPPPSLLVICAPSLSVQHQCSANSNKWILLYAELNWRRKKSIFSRLCECMYVVSEKWPCLVVLRGSWFLVERKNLHTPNIYAF